jgi:hypothetical protein
MSLIYINPYSFAAASSGPLATGGNDVNDYSEGGINYRAHIFTSDGTLTFSAGGAVEYLVVAGGGGGGGGWQAGGGGAGGYLSASTSVTARAYTVTIGAGGTGRTVGGAAATNGANSVLQDIATAVGGGRGASESPNAAAKYRRLRWRWNVVDYLVPIPLDWCRRYGWTTSAGICRG